MMKSLVFIRWLDEPVAIKKPIREVSGDKSPRAPMLVANLDKFAARHPQRDNGPARGDCCRAGIGRVDSGHLADVVTGLQHADFDAVCRYRHGPGHEQKHVVLPVVLNDEALC